MHWKWNYFIPENSEVMIQKFSAEGAEYDSQGQARSASPLVSKTI
jgi:hypothetical protein